MYHVIYFLFFLFSKFDYGHESSKDLNMKKTLFFSILSLCYISHAEACSLYFYVDKTAPKDVVFNIISTDNKYQITTSPVPPGQSWLSGLVCDSYNIYAQEVDTKNKVNPYGDYAYIANPLQLTGDLSVFFPTRFKPSTEAQNLNFPKQFTKAN